MKKRGKGHTMAIFLKGNYHTTILFMSHWLKLIGQKNFCFLYFELSEWVHRNLDVFYFRRV